LPSIFDGGFYSDPVVTGRDILLTQKVEALVRGKDSNFAIVGAYGIGKTSFASAIAQHPRIQKRFKDGILWVNLGRNADPSRTFAGWSRLLGIDLIRNATTENRIRAIKQATCTREFLTILDDVEDLEIAYSLSSGVPGCKLIVISESIDIGRTFSGRRSCVELTGLDSETSSQIVNTRNQGQLNIIAEQIEELINACEGNPLLLLRTTAYFQKIHEINQKNKRLGEEAAYSISKFLEKIQQYSDGLQKLNLVTDSILRLLPSNVVTGFYRLGAFAPEPALFDRNAAMAICRLNSDEVQELIDLNILSERAKSLCLPRDIADLIHTHAPHGATRSHREYYYSLLTSCLNDQNRLESIYAQVKWFSKLSTHDKFDPPLIESLDDYLEANGLWEDYLEIGEKDLQDTRRIMPNDRLAKLYTGLARIHSILNQKDRAIEYYQLALNFTDLKDCKSEQAQILNNIGTIYASLLDNEKAIKYLREASSIDGINSPLIEANVSNNLGKVEFDLGNYGSSMELLQKAATLIPVLDDQHLIINIHFNLAKALYIKGDLRESVNHLRQAVEIEREIKDPDLEQDMELLIGMEEELSMPKIARWFRRRFSNVGNKPGRSRG
jgi:tetratricopeptide (TPR) repeat protein